MNDFFPLKFAAVNIPYSFVTSVLNHYGFNQSDNVPVLKAFQLTSLLHDIYFAADKCDYFAQSVDFNLDRCTAILANFFWSVFDPYVLDFCPFYAFSWRRDSINLSIMCFLLFKESKWINITAGIQAAHVIIVQYSAFWAIRHRWVHHCLWS